MPPSYRSKVLIVSHDAGGAEIVSAWVRNNPQNAYEFLLEGPAVNIFKRKINAISRLTRNNILNANEFSYDFVLTGTSWNSDLERMIIQHIKNQSIPVICFLDHWSEYLIRFKMHNSLILPDEIWVGDEFGYKIANETFWGQSVKICLKSNPYFQEIKEEFERINYLQYITNTKKILFVTEPISNFAQEIYGNSDHYEVNELKLLSKFVNLLAKDNFLKYEIRVRPHPSEPHGKYTAMIRQYNSHLNIKISNENSIITDCAWADWVVGFDSMALVVALIGGKKVSSCLEKNCAFKKLPFQEIDTIVFKT